MSPICQLFVVLMLCKQTQSWYLRNLSSISKTEYIENINEFQVELYWPFQSHFCIGDQKPPTICVPSLLIFYYKLLYSINRSINVVCAIFYNKIVFCCDMDGLMKKKNHEILTVLYYKPLCNINRSENWGKKYTNLGL